MITRPLHDRRLRAVIVLTVLLASLATAALAATRTVYVKDNYFSAKTVTVNKGASVSWQWKGYLNHNVTVKSGPVRFHSPTQHKGTFTHTFLRAGTYRLYCTIHPYMKMTVVVR